MEQAGTLAEDDLAVQQRIAVAFLFAFDTHEGACIQSHLNGMFQAMTEVILQVFSDIAPNCQNQRIIFEDLFGDEHLMGKVTVEGWLGIAGDNLACALAKPCVNRLHESVGTSD